MKHVFIDGSAGTTGLRISERLAGREDIRLITLPEEKRKAIASIKEGQYGTEVKVHDKVKALELLAKHLGMFDSKNGGSEAPENNIFEVIDQSTREEIGTDEIPEIEHPAKPGHDLVE